MMTLSIVSHRQGRMVERLLMDLERIASPLVTAIIVTRNVEERAILVPESLERITKIFDNIAPRGFGANHNAAFQRCESELFVVLNPDIRLPADPFPDLSSSFRTSPSNEAASDDIALVAPRIVAPSGLVEDSARKLITPWQLLRHRIAGRQRRAAEDFDWLAGMFFVVRSTAFCKVHGFDERYFLYCEDFDLCARLRLAGWSIVIAESVSAIHDAQRASHRSWKHLAWHVTSLLRMWMSPTFWRYLRASRKRLTQ